MKSNVKKFASILLAVVMLFSMSTVFAVSAAEAPDAVGAGLKVTGTSNFCTPSASATVSAGSTVQMAFTTPSELNVVSMQWGLNFDKSKLKLTSIETFTNSMVVNENATSYAAMGSVSNDTTPIALAEGATVVTCRFKVLAIGSTEVELKMIDLMNRTDKGDELVVVNGNAQTQDSDLTFNARSNFFAAKADTFRNISSFADSNGDVYVAIEYKVCATDKYIINIDIDELTYDPAVLEWQEAYNTYGSGRSTVVDFFPFAAEKGFGTGTLHMTKPGRLVGNFSSVSPAAFASNEDGSPITAVRVVFKVIDTTATTTIITCNVDTLTYCDTSVEQPYMQYLAVDKKTVNAANKGMAAYSTVITPGVKVDYLLGDVDGNGKVEINDVTVLQRYLAEFISYVDKVVADVNGDGRVDVQDITDIQRYLADIIPAFR